MSNTVIVGLQYGDEGKGKIVDLLAGNHDIVVRFQGGNNAGHTLVVNGKKIVLHQIPSGALHDAICVIGNGTVVDLTGLVEEIKMLESIDIDIKPRLKISDRAHVILPHHKALDILREGGSNPIGTTKRGIGPAYADKANRDGLRIADIGSFEKVKQHLINHGPSLVEFHSFQIDELTKQINAQAEYLQPMIADTVEYLHKANEFKLNILLEGAQGTFLDIDHGTYPYVTSSNTTAGAACTGTGLGPTAINEVIGVFKAYSTRVGEGPFETEMDTATGDHIRQLGNEHGATTGRPRRVGWLDMPALRRAIRLNGVTSLAIMKLDVLSNMDYIKVLMRYDEDRQPIYSHFKGWKADISKAKSLKDLPVECLRYLKFIENHCPSCISLVSVGPDRNQTIEIKDSSWTC